jgi:hypothetical protein
VQYESTTTIPLLHVGGNPSAVAYIRLGTQWIAQELLIALGPITNLNTGSLIDEFVDSDCPGPEVELSQPLLKHCKHAGSELGVISIRVIDSGRTHRTNLLPDQVTVCIKKITHERWILHADNSLFAVVPYESSVEII